MGQTTIVFPRLKQAYRRVVRHPVIDRAVHGSLDVAVESVARLRGFSFPTKFNWDWKWEMLSGAYEKDTVAVFRKILKPGMVVVDIGAHVGYFTRLYGDLVGPNGSVHAFEADPENYALLERNVRGRTNVKTYAQAIADRVGTIAFYETENHTGCHSLVASDSRPHTLTVSCTTLDELIRRGTMPRVDVIKMDIEGGEPIALRGMRETIAANPDIVLVTEFCPDNFRDTSTTPSEYLAQLHELGLRTFSVTAEGLKEITPELNRVGTWFIKPDYHYVNILAAKTLPVHLL
jgi:FkbM family methyltransferase